MLIDGGRSGSFSDHAVRSVSECKVLDVVCVSHIDADHISGILKLLEIEVDWRIHLFEKEHPPQGRARKRKPRLPRPPQIKEIWHNGFADQLGDAEEDVRNMLGLAASAQLALQEPDLIPREFYLPDLALGEEQAIELAYRIDEDQLNIPLNTHFGGRLVRAGGNTEPFPMGDTLVTIVGPFQSDLMNLREQWRRWVQTHEERIDALRKEMDEEADRLGLGEADRFLATKRALTTSASEFGNRSDVTTPNLASIMMLAEENGARVLLTGDGAGQDILKGLEKADRLNEDGQIHVDVLKIQHHGATANINLEFLQRVVADHYVFCGNGSHHNPELGVVELVADSRFGSASRRSEHEHAGERFMVHFNSSKSVASTSARKKHMTALEKHARKLAKSSQQQMKVHFNAEDFFDIGLD